MAKFLKTLFFLLIGGALLNVSSHFSQAGAQTPAPLFPVDLKVPVAPAPFRTDGMHFYTRRRGKLYLQ